MENIIKLYKNISFEMLKILKNEKIDNDVLDSMLSKRQSIIEALEKENKIEEFKVMYKEEVHKIDEEIKRLFQENIDSTKKEMTEYRKNKNGNFAYANINKSNLNIFSKKV